MKKRKVFLWLACMLIFGSCVVGSFFGVQKAYLSNYHFKIEEPLNIDKTLSAQRYLYTTEIDKKYVAVITYRTNEASMNQYLVNQDGTQDLNVKKGTQLVISLHANRTIAYTWNIKNDIDSHVLQLNRRAWMEIPTPMDKREETGVSYDRQNFYFKPVGEGIQKVIVRYEHIKEKNAGGFEITFNIHVTE